MNTFLAILAALGGVSFVGTAIKAFADRRLVKAAETKTGAEAASVLTASALSMLEAVQAEADGLRRDLAACRSEVTALRRHVSDVEARLRAHGVEVPAFVWPPATGNSVMRP